MDNHKRSEFWLKKYPHLGEILIKLNIIVDTIYNLKKDFEISNITGDLFHTIKNGNFVKKINDKIIDYEFFKKVMLRFADVLELNHFDGFTSDDYIKNSLKKYIDFITSVNEDFPEGDYETYSIIHLSLKPQMELISSKFDCPIELEHPIFNNCPICGALPYISDFRGENRNRYLHCSLCGSIWRFPRLQCAFCNNNNTDEIGYYVLENSQSNNFRVDYCTRCNFYIKNIDFSQYYELPPMSIEDTVSLHLDYKAMEMGFIKPTPNYIGFLFIHKQSEIKKEVK